MSLNSITVTQNEISNVAPGFVNTQVIGIEIDVDGLCSNFNVSDFDFSTVGEDGTDNVLTTVNNAHLYYTGNTAAYSTTNLFGSYTSPNGSFTISGSQTLSSGINYFWLAYDLDVDALTGDKIDASCSSVTFDEIGNQSTSNSSPTGSRMLSAYYLVNTGVWSKSDNWALDSCGGDGLIDGTIPDGNDAVIICSGNTVELDGDVTVGSVILKDGGLITDNSNLRNFTINETLISYGTGKITMNETGSFSLTGDCSLLGSDTIKINGTSTFSGNFLLENTKTIANNGASNINLSGINCEIDGTINLNGSGDLIFNGTSTQSISGNGQVISSSSSNDCLFEVSNKNFTTSSDITIEPKVSFNDHNITASNYGIVSLKYNGVSGQGELDASTNNNSWTNQSNSTLNYGGIVKIFDFKGDLYASALNNTVSFNSSSDQSIHLPSDGTFYNLIVSGSGFKTLQEDINIIGDFDITETSIFQSNNFNIDLQGNWNNTSSHITGTSTVTFNGSLGQYINSNSSQEEAFYNLKINKTGKLYLTSNSDVTIYNTLDLTNGLLNIGSSNIIFESSASSINHSHSSFIQTDNSGFVRKMWSSPGSFVYPVGDVDSLSEFTIQLLSATLDVNAYSEMNVSSGKYSEISESSGNYINRYWELNATGINSPIYNFTAQYLESDVIGDENQIIAKKYGTEWIEFDSANVSVNTLTGSFATSFSKFSGFEGLSALPVELIEFKVKNINHSNFVYWKTGSEINNSHFELYRSKDGGEFVFVESFQGQGNSLVETEYNFNDENLESGKYLYILKQVDFNGDYSFSEKIFVEIKSETAIVIFYSTENKTITLSSPEVHEIILTIYDLNGKEIFKNQNCTTNSSLRITEDFSPGFFIIQAESKGQFFNQKILIK